MRTTSALLFSLALIAATIQPSLAEDAQKTSQPPVTDEAELPATATAEPWEQARHQTEMTIVEKK